jgi:Asp-tRNA(Asn)/Glu-tRNA(Gln) amidotransferase A subunit family amidase
MTYTVLQDLLGLPACALPIAFDDLGLPVAVQITAGPWQEALVLRLVGALHAALPEELRQRRPAIAPG